MLSAIILSLSMVKFREPDLPIKASYNMLSADMQKQVQCLAENIYFEAGHEPYKGKQAVGFVTLNRLQTGNYANNICGVVQQRDGNLCQFSWYCDKTITSKRLTIKHTPLYNEILEIATNLVVNFEILTDVTDGATYYHADYVHPKWKLEKVDQIGRHIFYRSRKDDIDRSKGII
jgi:spore germination cell wall hydrolase CwlJ-like protein